MSKEKGLSDEAVATSRNEPRRRVTIRDVARGADVSHQTVSRAINNAYGIDPATRERVLKVARDLQFTPNSLAQGLARRRSHTIGLAIPTLTNPFFAEVTQAIIDACEERDHAVVVVPTWETAEGELAALATLLPRSVDGVVGFFERHEAQEIHAELRFAPFVMLNGESRDVSTVNVDIGTGMDIAVDHLTGLGHRRIALLDGSPADEVRNIRRERYVDAMSRHGIRVEQGWMPHAPNNLGGGRLAGEALLAAHPDITAVVAYNDAMAVGLIGLLAERGLTVPADVSVVGFDGIQFGAVMQPVLTTVATDFSKLAEESIAELFRLIDADGEVAPCQQVVETVLRIGGTTAPMRNRGHH